MKIIKGEAVLAVLQNPREKIWGILREVNASGIFLCGIDINSFEEFILAASGETPFYGLGEQFIPMWRVERITKDDADGDIPSMQEQFEQRTGKTLAGFIG